MPLTSTQARAAIAAAESTAAAMGVPVVVAVIDAGTHLKAFSRMDGDSPVFGASPTTVRNLSHVVGAGVILRFSHRETVTFVTPSRSASSACVQPRAFRRLRITSS